jgi:hypothetical protein
MIWQDLMLDRWVDAETLRVAAASALGVPPDTVAVVDAPEELLALTPMVRVVAERVRQHRDFPLQILVALREEALVNRLNGFERVLPVAQVLARHAGASVLFAEGPLAPSEWVRVRPTGQTDVVSLDVDDTGDVDSYFVVGERPLAQDQACSTSKPTRRTA